MIHWLINIYFMRIALTAVIQVSQACESLRGSRARAPLPSNYEDRSRIRAVTNPFEFFERQINGAATPCRLQAPLCSRGEEKKKRKTAKREEEEGKLIGLD